MNINQSAENYSVKGLSPYFSTCETKRQTPQPDILKYLPLPTSIHDYIDDVIEINKDCFEASYF